MVKKKKNKRLKKVLLTLTATFGVLLIAFYLLFSRSNIYPFKYMREVFVGTGMTTATYRDLVRFLIPADEIKRIVALGNPIVSEKTETGEIIIGYTDYGPVAKTTPHPDRPLRITLLKARAVLAIENIKKASGGEGSIYIREEIRGASARVDADKRYNYEYEDPRRYLVEKGMDEYYIDVVNVKSQLFRGRLMIISDPSKVVVSKTKKLNVVGESLKTLINNVGGVGGINAGGFVDAGWAGNGGKPIGLVVSKGKEYSPKGSKAICGFTKDDKLVVGYYSWSSYKNLKLRDAVEFSPPLIVNGKPTFSYGTNAATGIHPRTAIGQKKSGEVILLTIDGRQKSSVGASLYDVQNILQENGAINACNLDGGHSSFMMFKKKMISNPYHGDKEKPLPDAFVVVP